jgi:hypothetical protein
MPTAAPIPGASAYVALVMIRPEGHRREQLIAEIVASASPVLALWTLQDVRDIGTYRDPLLRIIAEKGDSAIASQALRTIPDCGTLEDRLHMLAASDT